MAANDDRLPRDYEAYLRGPVGLNTFAFCTNNTPDAYRGGVVHQPLFAAVPEVHEPVVDDFGILASPGFTVEIADELTDADWYVLQEDFSRIVLEDGAGALIMEY